MKSHSAHSLSAYSVYRKSEEMLERWRTRTILKEPPWIETRRYLSRGVWGLCEDGEEMSASQS
jgi:hypothetical protein